MFHMDRCPMKCQWGETPSLFILSSNYHQCVNLQSVLCTIDGSHCHHWLDISFCRVVLSTHSYPLHIVSLSQVVYQVGTHEGMCKLEHIAVCKMYWKSKWQNKHTFTRQKCVPSRPGKLQPAAVSSQLVCNSACFWPIYHNTFGLSS